MIETAMILAAGFGTRLKPITDHIPKPLVPVAGRPLIDHAIDRLVASGVTRVVVNTHYKAEMIAAHLSARSDVAVALSHEDALLDTGGGVKNALRLLGDPFYIVNADVLWLDDAVPALTRLARAWDADRLDALMLVQRTATANGYDGKGDFMLAPDGRIRRRAKPETALYLFGGIEVASRRLFAASPEGAFSLNSLWDRAIAADRIAALVHDGEWYHVGTPQGLAAAEERLKHHGGRRGG